jgi:hypothetical protein
MHMAEKPFVDRSLWIPTGLGLLAMLGICLVLIALRVRSLPATPLEQPTETPLKFQYLATEPGVVLPTAVDTLTPDPATHTPAPTLPIFEPDANLDPTEPFATLPVFPTSTREISTAVDITSLPIGLTFDDADIRMIYDGNWIAQSGVRDAFQSTLHLSSTIGDSLELVFFGQKIRLTYQAGPGLGQIALKLDELDFVLDQSSSETSPGIWDSPILPLTSHVLTITHISGGAINIDALVVIDIATATPTITPTVTTTPNP